MQDSKFKPLRSEAEDATSRSQTLPTILSFFTSGWGRKISVSIKPPRPGNELVKGSSANYPLGGVKKHTNYGIAQNVRQNDTNIDDLKINIEHLRTTNHFNN